MRVHWRPLRAHLRQEPTGKRGRQTGSGSRGTERGLPPGDACEQVEAPCGRGPR